MYKKVKLRKCRSCGGRYEDDGFRNCGPCTFRIAGVKRDPKFARPLAKKKPAKANHITKQEYQKTTAKSVDSSLDDFFKEK